jgi:calcium-dependent protein kinase
LFSSRQSRRVTLTPSFALVERRRERKEKLKQRRSCTCSSSAGTPKVGSEKRYAASVTVDEEILLVSPTRLLLPEECTRIFGYPRAELMAEKYKLGKVVGAGSFGVVREAVKLSTGERVAVKTVSKMLKRIPKHLRRQGDRGTISKHLNKLQLEVDAMKCLRGSLNAVSLYDLYEGDEEVHLVMELCEGGTIYERITAQDFTEASAAGVARSILQMISQCHSKGVIYMDVKPENFLYLTNDTASVLKGTDFGLALKYTQGEKLATRRGTPVYMAPDVILKSYDPKVDCWSAGVLIFQLLHGRLPYADKLQGHSVREVWEMIINSDIDLSESTWKNFSSDSKDFISKLLQRDPESRLSAVDALKHPWLQEGAISTQDEKRPLQRSIIQRLQRFGTYSFLKQIVLSQIAEEASKLSDMSPHILDFFNSLDKDKNGTISYSELRQGLSKAGYLLADSEAQQLLSAIDTDGNGVLDLNEIFASLVDWNDLQKDENWPRWCKKMFEKLDMDRSGFIDLEELAKLVPSNMRGQRTVNALRMLREVDTNGDGKISYEEFMHMMNAEDEFLLVEFDSRLSQASFGDSTDLGSFDGSGDFGSI